MSTIDDVINLIDEYSNIADFVGKRDDTTIEAAEKKLEIKLPKSFKKFLTKKGGGNFGSKEIYGFIRDELFKDEEYKGSIPNLFWLIQKFRKDFNLPHHIILISDIGDGSYYALDLSQMNKEQECPVVIWPVGGYDETPELEIVAPDFGNWFYDQVQEQIERLQK